MEMCDTVRPPRGDRGEDKRTGKKIKVIMNGEKNNGWWKDDGKRGFTDCLQQSKNLFFDEIPVMCVHS